MTLAELQALRASWLRQARESGDIDSLILIIRTLGKPGDVKGWPLWKMYELKRGGVVARLYEGTGDYLPGSRDYNRIQTLAVYASGYQVCYIRQSDAGSPQDDNLFRPGQWQRAILAELERARAVYAARRAANEEGQRSALLEQLLIGIEI